GLASLTQKKIWRFSALSTLNKFANSFTIIVLPLYALAIGTDEAFYGFMVAMAGYLQAATLFPAGTLSDRHGRGIALLIGGLVSGLCFMLMPFIHDTLAILVIYALTGVGTGFTSSSYRAIIADYTEVGTERTKSYGITDATGTFAAMIGPFIAGFVLDPSMLSWITTVMTRYAILFFLIGGVKIASGVLGISTDYWLRANSSDPFEPTTIDPQDSDEERKGDAVVVALFGLSRVIMGLSSGMVVPYLIPWIYAAFSPDPLVLGIVPSISNMSLAWGLLVVGFTSERIGKLRLILILYLITPLLTIGFVYAPLFIIAVIFYIARSSVANMVQPASTSLLMSEIAQSKRGRSWAVVRILWTFPRQTGTLIAAFILGSGIAGGIVNFGLVVFPLAMCFYPVSVIPMWLAVRRNQQLLEQEP
ncbi:MAG: MFS transporter, partial [Candidatus Thorarchaeota archaeon]